MTRLLILLSVASPLASAQTEVVPFVECVERPIPLDLGSSILPYYQVYFGFFNTTTDPVTFSSGSFRNQVIPGSTTRGQQSIFPPGVYRRVFSAFTSSPALTTWDLNQALAIAGDNHGQYCPEPDTTPFLVVGAPLKLIKGSSYVGLEVAKMLTAAPLAAVPSFDAHVYGRTASSLAPVLNSDLAVRNLRLEGAVVKADIDVATVPSNQNHALALTVSLNGEQVASKSLLVQTLTGCPLVFSPGALPAAMQSVPYAPVGFSATGDTAPYTFELAAGTLPGGMQLTAGSLSGTPAETGAFPLTIAATSATNCLAQANYTLIVTGPSCSADVTPQIALTLGGFRQNLVTGRWQQTVTVRNAGASPINALVALALENLSANATLYNATGRTQCAAPLGRPYVLVNTGADSILSPNETISVALEFINTTPGQAITYTPRIVAGGPQQ